MCSVRSGFLLQDAVPILFERGWTAIPLGLDAKGKPKRPLPKAWQSTPHRLNHILALPWAASQGLGIVLGPVSDNLAVIDIDDQEMARAIFALMIRGKVYTRMVWTGRNNLHVYVREQTPSSPTIRRVKWHEKEIAIELKAKGQQVAAPPSPGYTLCDREGWKPIDVPSVGSAWLSISRRLGCEEAGEQRQGAGYPKPWAKQVGVGDRNKAIYVEAHRLREAGMPLMQAVEYMRVRWDASYAHEDASWQEAEGTIRSAYRHGEIQDTRGVAARWANEL